MAIDDPRLYYRMDDADISGSTITDRGSAGINGTLVNPPTSSTGRILQARTFDGTNYITPASSPISGTGSFSIFAWVKAAALSSRMAVINIGQGSVSNDGVFLYIQNGLVTFDLTNVAGGSSAATVNDNTWHHIGLINTANSFQIKVDGASSGSAVTRSPNISGSNSNAIARQPNFSFPYTGSIDEVRVYNRALSAADVTALYNLRGVVRRALTNRSGSRSAA